MRCRSDEGRGSCKDETKWDDHTRDSRNGLVSKFVSAPDKNKRTGEHLPRPNLSYSPLCPGVSCCVFYSRLLCLCLWLEAAHCKILGHCGIGLKR